MICFPTGLVCGLTGITRDVRKGPAIAVSVVAGLAVLLWLSLIVRACVR